MSDQSTEQLHEYLASWNPALRQRAARELASRADEVLVALKDLADSENGNMRAGVGSALWLGVRHRLRNWRDYAGESGDREALRARLRETYGSVFLALAGDERSEARWMGLKGLQEVQLNTPEAVKAVLALCEDPNEHLATEAVISLNRTFDVELADENDVSAAIKSAMNAPLPRGKGSALKLIQEMDEASQRAFIPVLLDHLDWQPDRDTMFGASGQAEALALLTKLRVKEVVPRIPGLMKKTMRGPGLFEPCIDSVRAFGEDAKVILPQLRVHRSELEQRLEKPMRGSSRRELQLKLYRLKEVIDHVENL